jgi:hypothetical protein
MAGRHSTTAVYQSTSAIDQAALDGDPQDPVECYQSDGCRGLRSLELGSENQEPHSKPDIVRFFSVWKGGS